MLVATFPVTNSKHATLIISVLEIWLPPGLHKYFDY